MNIYQRVTLPEVINLTTAHRARGTALLALVLAAMGCTNSGEVSESPPTEPSTGHSISGDGERPPEQRRRVAPSERAATPAKAGKLPPPPLGKIDPKARTRVVSDYRSMRRGNVLYDEDDGTFQRLARRLGIRDSWLLDAPMDAAAPGVWFMRLIADAQNGIVSVIRFSPEHCVGYGCRVPSAWTAVGCGGPGDLFVSFVGDTKLLDACRRCSTAQNCRPHSCNVIVEGHFTGSRTTTRRCSGYGYEFNVLRARRSRSAQRMRPTLRLAGGSPGPDGPVIADGPRWGVMWASAFMMKNTARKQADVMAAKITAAGFNGVDVLDSRQIPGLWCCSYAVLIGRFADKQSAAALATKLKAKNIRDVIVRKLY